jgi:gas vesicle protein GvpL/GvpF
VTTQPHAETVGREPEGGDLCYVYAIVPAEAALPEGLSGTDGSELSLLRHGDLAAVVSEVSGDRPLGTREDLLAHEVVVESLATETTVLPMRFGAVVRTADAVVDELMAPYHDWFSGALAELTGRAEFVVVGTYVRDAVLREVLEEEPEAGRLRERVRELPDDAGYYDRIRLGELIVQALDGKREKDNAALAQAIAPHAAAVAPRQAVGDDTAADVAFLVSTADLPQFEDAVEDLGRHWAGRIRLRMLGPLAPYDFVPPAPDEEAETWDS